jgi:myosin-crossreactive antigen
MCKQFQMLSTSVIARTEYTINKIHAISETNQCSTLMVQQCVQYQSIMLLCISVCVLHMSSLQYDWHVTKKKVTQKAGHATCEHNKVTVRCNNHPTFQEDKEHVKQICISHKNLVCTVISMMKSIHTNLKTNIWAATDSHT